MKTCTRCGEAKPVAAFHFPKDRAAPRANCRACDTVRHREWAQNNKAHLAGKDRERWKQIGKWAAHIKRKYGITAERYYAMLSAQGGACAICRTEKPGRATDRFHVDHCHATGKVRGLLCSRCNQMLGQAHDDVAVLTGAIAYLQQSEALA